jgi:hypothetical protein
LGNEQAADDEKDAHCNAAQVGVGRRQARQRVGTGCNGIELERVIEHHQQGAQQPDEVEPILVRIDRVAEGARSLELENHIGGELRENGSVNQVIRKAIEVSDFRIPYTAAQF